MSIEKPSEEVIKMRAKEILEEASAYPEESRDQLLSVRKAAIQNLVDNFNEKLDVVAGHYPGWAKDDLQKLHDAIPDKFYNGEKE